MKTALDQQALDQRFIPFDSLRYSTEAFIDYRIPECSPKYNYALMGWFGFCETPGPSACANVMAFRWAGCPCPTAK